MASQVTKWFKNPAEVAFLEQIRERNRIWLATCVKCGTKSVQLDCKVNSPWLLPVCKSHRIHQVIEKELM